MPPSPVRHRLQRLRRWVLVHRRGLAATLAGLAVLVGLRAVTAPPVETVPTLVAATDLAGGTPVQAGDVRVADVPLTAVPTGALTDPAAVTGRVLAAPVRAGEPVTDVRVVAPRLLEGYPGKVAAPVRVADGATTRLLRTGDTVDLLAVPADGGPATVVAAGVPVVAVPAPAEDDLGTLSGGLVVVAVDREQALALAQATVTAVLSVVLTR